MLTLYSLTYNCVCDAYTRPNDKNNADTIPGWRSLAHEASNIFRKVEHDHRMSYLARTERSTSGTISWRVELASLPAKR